MQPTIILGTVMIALPVIAAQSQAPKASSASIFTQSRSYLGIGVADVTEERAKVLGLKEPQGVEVTAIREDFAAAKAGIRQGDVILEFNGQHVEGGAQFIRMVQETPIGRKVSMEVWRNRAKQAITVTIGTRPEEPMMFAMPGGPFPPSPPEALMIPDMPHDMFAWRSMALGVETEGLNSQLAEFFGVKEGVLVRAVTKGSAADTAGLKAGDVITKIDGQAVQSPRNIAGFLRKSGQNVTLTIVRNHKELTLNVKLASNLQRMDECFPAFRSQQREVL